MYSYFPPRYNSLNQIIWGSTRKEQNFSRNDLIIHKSLIVGLKNPLEGGEGVSFKICRSWLITPKLLLISWLDGYIFLGL